MKILLDTHVLVWALSSPEKIKPKVQDLLVDTDNIVFVSIASLWELQIKKSLNKISLPDDFISQLQENGFELLDINYKHITKLAELPLIHRDPFDRMLVAQTIHENLSLVTNDLEIMKYNVKIIEDASHAIGGSYQGEPIGNCQYSDITVFSFHPVKIVTTAEGGAALTNDHELAAKMALYRSHGITRNHDEMTETSHGAWYYQQITLGYNYRMTELQAALGISQMMRLTEFVAARHKIAEYYNFLLKDLPVQIPYQLENTYSGLHLYVIRLQLDEISATHKEVFDELRANQIAVNLHYIPVHMQPYYKAMGFRYGDFPDSEQYYKEAISLPMYAGLSQSDQDKVVQDLTSALARK